MTPTGADERAHEPGAAAGWCEAWQLDAASEDGAGLSVRLALFPALGIAWWWTHLFLPDVDGVVVVRDHEVGLPRQGLEIRADGLWAELTCEVPFEHWTYGLEAFGVRLDDPVASLRGEIGDRMPVGLDIEWEVDPHVGAPIESGRDGHSGYEQFGHVHGEVLLGRARYELDAVGLRAHTWGVPAVDRWSAWMRAQGLARRVRPEHARSETDRRADGLPTAVRYVVDDGTEIAGDVLGRFAVPLVDEAGARSTLARALCRYTMNGATALGWSSWVDPA
jgi:hypothetical protein